MLYRFRGGGGALRPPGHGAGAGAGWPRPQQGELAEEGGGAPAHRAGGGGRHQRRPVAGDQHHGHAADPRHPRHHAAPLHTRRGGRGRGAAARRPRPPPPPRLGAAAAADLVPGEAPPRAAARGSGRGDCGGQLLECPARPPHCISSTNGSIVSTNLERFNCIVFNYVLDKYYQYIIHSKILM